MLFLELLSGPVRDHGALVDHDDPLGEAFGLLHVLGRQEHRRPGGDELLDELPHVVAGTRVKAGRWLVEEQHRRSGDQARADVQPAAHPARVGLHEPVGGVGQPEALEHIAGAAAVLALVEVVPEADELEVLAAGQQLVDRGVLARKPIAPRSDPASVTTS